MSPRVVRYWGTRVGLLGGTALLLAGCPQDASEITAFASDPSWNFPVAGSYVEPVGSYGIESFVLADFDPDLTSDAFGRASGDFLGFNFSPARYLLDPAARNSTDDPRVPALGGLGTEAVGGNQCRFGDGDFWGGSDGWDFFCFLEGLRPNTDYTVMLVRYALTVNGDLDTEEILLSGAITQPDELALLGGTPGGYPLELCDFDPNRPTFTIGVTGDQNPLVMGFVTSNANGALVFDCLVGSGGFWSAGALTDPAEAPFAPNEIASFDVPRYNYVVVVEGLGTAIDPVPPGDHVMRFQVGVDIDASGTPIANGLAPLPDRAATDDELLFAPGGAGRPNELTATFNNLEELAGGAEYSAWLVNPVTGAFLPAIGTYNRIKIIAERDPITGEVISTRDSTPPVETVAGVNSFVGGMQEDGFRHQLVLTDAGLPGGAADSVGFYTHLVLTIAESPSLANMSDSRPLWFQYTDQGGTPDNFFDDAFDIDAGRTRFGNFDMADPADSRLFSGQGQGQGGFREEVLSIDMRRLSRPPVGYEFVAWVIDEDGNAVRMPAITGPPPERVSLTDADVQLIPDIVTSNGILEANFQATQSELGVTWFDVNADTLTGTSLRQVLVTLEAKVGDSGLGTIPVQIGAVPPRVVRGGN